MTERTPREIETAHSLLALGRNPIVFTNSYGGRLHIQDPGVYTQDELQSLRQHHQHVSDHERGVYPSSTILATANRPLYIPNAFPHARSPYSPHALQMPAQTPQAQTENPRFVRLNSTINQTFCSHISKLHREPDCVETRCRHFCCRRSHEIWDDLKRTEQEQAQSMPVQPPPLPPARRGPGRPRKYVAEALPEMRTASHEQPLALAPTHVNRHLPDSFFESLQYPIPSHTPHGLPLLRSGQMIMPTTPAPPSSYSPGQNPTAPSFQPQPLPLPESVQGPQYGLLRFRDGHGGKAGQHTMRPMQADRPVFDFRSTRPMASRRAAEFIDLTNDEDTQMAGGDRTVGVSPARPSQPGTMATPEARNIVIENAGERAPERHRVSFHENDEGSPISLD